MARIKPVLKPQWKSDSEAWGFGKSNLYVVQEGDDDYVKIGVAGHPVRRLSQLQCGNRRKLILRAVYEGTPSHCCEIERYAHKYFNASGSEWVYAKPEDVIEFLNAFVEAEK